MREQPRIIDAEFTVVEGPVAHAPQIAGVAALLRALRPMIRAIGRCRSREHLALAQGAASALGLFGAGALLATLGARVRRRDDDQSHRPECTGVVWFAVFEQIWFAPPRRD